MLITWSDKSALIHSPDDVLTGFSSF